IEGGQLPPVVKVGSLTAMRDFLDVRDVVVAYCEVLRQDASRLRETFNVSSGDVLPIGNLLDMLLAMARVPIRVEQDSARLRASDVPSARIDATKLREWTGWHPRYALVDTVGAVLDDCRRHHGV
ncbi:GDP-mannose 4,6-dehydratase, partial [Streptomonospora algeriensis]